MPQHLHDAGRGLVQADDLAQQHRLARTRSAHQHQDFAREDGQVQIVVDHVVAKSGAQAAHRDDGFDGDAVVGE
ncbi:hypothetical protein G6F55_014675 [Rhizopus delemar]|nr:hypothetical protein G6F55_014675 [Rhizopus delemar]